MFNAIRRTAATVVLAAAVVTASAGAASAAPGRESAESGCNPLPTICTGGDARWSLLSGSARVSLGWF
jgi:hypothetical protein